VPIALFAAAGSIWWMEGALLSVGSIAGGHVGAKLSSHDKAKIWVFRILLVVVGVELVHLAIHYFGAAIHAATGI
jgi:hypothetical protein